MAHLRQSSGISPERLEPTSSQTRAVAMPFALGSIARFAGELLVGRRGPAGEQVERFLASRADFGGEREHDEVWIGGECHPFVAEFEVADERVVESL